MLRYLITLSIIVFIVNAQVNWWLTAADKSSLLQQQQSLQVQTGTSTNTNAQLVVLDNAQTYQTIYGFGGALTESAAYVLLGLKNANSTWYWQVLSDLFTSNGQGAGMNVLRVTLSASDFTVGNWYTYDDTNGDYSLSNVSLSHDEAYLIPVLQDIIKVNPNVQLIGAPWSAPTWLKSSGSFTSGTLSDPTTYAKYYVKVLQDYKQIGINFWAISLQNEPLNGANSYPVMLLEPSQEVQLLQILGPLLSQAGFGGVRVIVYDHNWNDADYAIEVFQDPTANKYATASAFHCYAGDVSNQTVTHNAYPNKELYFTECSGTGPSNFGPNLQWNTINLYIGSTSNWAQMVLHWNLALNDQYGPHNGGCSNCRGIITIATDNSWVAYNEEYYGVAQFGKFTKQGAVRVQTSFVNGWNCMMGTVFKNPDNSLTAMIINYCQTTQWTTLQRSGQYVETNVPVGVATFVWS